MGVAIQGNAFNPASCGPPGGEVNLAAATAEFARTLSGTLGPVPSVPRCAVAVSGGADSMALCRLATDWVKGQGGDLTALTVDHGLRQGSAEEARCVADWMRRFGIKHRILDWIGAKPASGVQEAARAERYRLLLAWCREHAIRYLLLGHHRSDQAETVLHRLLRGSGLSGLAGMAAVVETADVRIVRPLLTWSPAVLRGLLDQWGWPWLEDPSNRDARFARTRLRKASASLAAFGVTTDALLALAADAAEARSAMQAAAEELISAACSLHPAGFARIDRRVLGAAPAEVAAAALARLLAAIGGGAYVPTAARVRTVLPGLTDGTTRSLTFCRCRVVSRDDALWLFREHRGLPGEMLLQAACHQLWDGRFEIACRSKALQSGRELRVRPFTADDVRTLRAARWAAGVETLPSLARGTLPILSDEKGLAMVPVLEAWRPDFRKLHGEIVQMAWKPRHGIAEGGCFIR